MITRREFGLGCLALGGNYLFGQRATSDSFLGAPLPPWSPGELDIHHIDTGRGNATFILAPDGTTLLIDCGASNDGSADSAPCRPDESRRPGEWVARYALRCARSAQRNTLDYLIATHIHPDHVGDVPPGAAASKATNFVPTGVSEVDQWMPAMVVIDRSYPDYGILRPLKARFANNYLAWLDSRTKSGKRVERLVVGSDQQIRLRSATPYPNFAIRGIAANGLVWTGHGTEARSVFPDLAKIPSNDLPSENACSIALRLSYGRFSYFTGGDLAADTRDGRLPWMDVETPTVEAAGRVEVAVADHHAYFDACGPEFPRALNAQAYVIFAWHITHPGSAQIERLLGAWPGEKRHDVFSTEMLPANQLFNSRWVGQMRSKQGHVVVRVAPDGASYRIFVVDSSQEDGAVKLVCGPYTCRA